ncbi:hypothetical protein PY093_20575 [Cytobacillus sp. S13-E01]|uniref:hypothetical protein n=1 Tax=Cytobacillus sp. S13-E01 TaxID=3031326 RepID=UPI0023D8BFB4|nr:hypothetical protein [Cytobacillus sp. S13-E01]MDF0729007.1 hypothetical protein [Cytobacillus sp. S13-E01]
MKKKFLSIALCLSIMLLLTSQVSAKKVDESEVSVLFTNFIDSVFDDLSNLNVLDSSGSDITEEFIEETSDFYDNEDYKSIQNLIKDNDLSVSLIKIDNLNIESISDIRSKTVSKEYYEYATSDRGYSGEWIVNVTGNYSYNASTYAVTYASTPSISLTATNFGASFSPYMDNVNTSSSYSGSTATFTATYTMRAVQGIKPITVDHYYGSFAASFQDHPLQ